MKKLTPIIIIRSIIFNIIQIIITPIFFILGLCCYPLGHKIAYQMISSWSKLLIFLAKVICGITYSIKGFQNIPKNQAVIIMSKHQSAWETLAFQVFFPPQVWVLKKELLKIPFFGWGLKLLNPIAIDRSNIREALRQVGEQGKDRLNKGLWVVVFPEGTRMAVGEKTKYQPGGAYLAIQANTPILPVAHNAGTCWGKHAFFKFPGEITVSIGELIYPENQKAGEITQKVEHWIENEMSKMSNS